MREVAGDAAVLVDPRNVQEITEAMARVAEEASLRAGLSQKGLKRASAFSWKKTAEVTMEVYKEAIEMGRGLKSATTYSGKQVAAGFGPGSQETVRTAIHKTIEYAKLFQYRLRPDELRESLLDIDVDEPVLR